MISSAVLRPPAPPLARCERSHQQCRQERSGALGSRGGTQPVPAWPFSLVKDPPTPREAHSSSIDQLSARRARPTAHRRTTGRDGNSCKRNLRIWRARSAGGGALCLQDFALLRPSFQCRHHEHRGLDDWESLQHIP